MIIYGDNINQYLDKFFNGETTRAEEIELGRYFRETPSLPAELSPYKAMFRWIDDGMPETYNKRKPKILRSAFVWITSAAALIAFVVTIALNKQHTSIDPELIYKGSYVERNSIKNENIAAIMPEIQSTIKQVDEMQQEFEHLNFDSPDFRI